MESTQINRDFAKAWDNKQGNFAEGIAKDILTFAENKKIKIKSVMDICCGASNLLEVFQSHGFECYGTESRQGMYEYSKEKLPSVKYFLTEHMYDVPGKHKVDLITCTHDVVNYFESFDNWITFFKSVEKHLNKKGLFVFDFYTKSKLKDWNETTYSASDWIDCLTSVKSGLYDKTVINYTYYINYENYMIKTRDIVVESYFENQVIFDALAKCGFKNVMITDQHLNPLENIEFADRIHIVAMKK